MNPSKERVEEAKRKAASEAVKHVEDRFVVGLGSGSTAACAINLLGAKIKNESLRVLGIPTSYQAFLLAVKNSIGVTTLEENPTIDLTIDGADQIDPEFNLIKGMGGALTREKVVASASKQNIIIADMSKRVDVLGENDHPVPIEVLPYAISIVARQLTKIGGKPLLREGTGKVGPIITDNGNVIIDVKFGIIDEPAELEKHLKKIPGIVETGLFIDLADLVYVATASEVRKFERK